MLRREQRIITRVGALLAVVFWTARASATDYTWSNTVSLTSDWSTPACWIGAVVPTAADDANIIFGPSTRTSPNQNIATPFALRSIDFTNTAPAYALGGSSLWFRTTSTLIQQDSAANQIVNESLVFANSITSLIGTGTGRLTLNGVISGTGSLSTGQSGVTPGTVRLITLNGANTSAPFPGFPSLYIDGGAFQPVVIDITLGNDAAIGTGDLNFRPGHILRAGNGARTIANPLLLNGNSGNGLPLVHTFGAGDPFNFTGEVTIGIDNAKLQIDNASTNFSGPITGSLFGSTTVTKMGAGDLVFAGPASTTWSDAVIIQSGRVVVVSPSALAKNVMVLSGGLLDFNEQAAVTLGGLANSGDLHLGNTALTLNVGAASTPTYQGSLTLDVVMMVLETGRLIKAGAGQINFAGPTNMSTVDRFHVADGTFQLDQGAILTTSGVDNVPSGPDLLTTIGGIGAAPRLRIVGGAKLNNPAGVLAVSGLSGTAVTIEGVGSTWVGGSSVVAGTVADYGPANCFGQIAVQNFGTLTSGVVLVGDYTGGFGKLVVDSSGQVLTGSIVVNGRGANPDQVRILGSGSLVRTANNFIIISNDAQGSHVLVKDGARLEVNNALTFSGPHTRIDVEGSTLSAGHLLPQTADVPALAISDSSGGTALTVGISGFSHNFGGTIMDAATGPGSFTKTGPGAMLVNGLLTYTGATTVNGGSLSVNSPVLGTSSVNVTSTLFLNGVTLGNAATNTFVGPSGFISAFGTINGSITNSGFLDTVASLVLTGSVTNFGILSTHRGSQLTFTGPILINEGRIDAIGGIFTPPANFINNGQLLTPASVRISQATRTGTNLTVTLPAYRGHSYQLQRSTSLSAANFVSVGGSQYLDADQTLVFTDANASGAEGFYRVIVDP